MDLKTINIEDEIKLSYLDYAMSVIIGRAIPDVRDGLKPVHRRIFYAMHELRNDFNKPYKKSARIVGDVIGKYHPHGDSAVYDALVRMAQDFSMRYQLVDGQGNFGSVDGDPPAAMRYTEVRMNRIGHEFMRDIEKETIPFQPNYDNTILEPVVLPARIPNLLLNGSSGIAVGMATNIPPHNLRELCAGLLAMLDDPDITVRDLMRYIPGPDFPTAGFICGCVGIKDAYETGRGTIKMRARVEVEESGRRNHLIITELPYQVNKARLLERIAELVKQKKIEGIQDIRDESDREGMRVVLTLRQGDEPRVIENQLYKHTALESSFGVIMLAVVDNKPEVLNLKGVLNNFLDFRRLVIIRRTQYELAQAEKRAHILEGLKRALDHLDEVISLIRAAKTPPEAKQGLMERFEFSDVQAQAILEMRLQRLTGLEREKIIEEYQEIIKEIERLRQILSSAALVDQVIREEIKELTDQYGDLRKTEILAEAGELCIEDLIAAEEMVVTISRAGYIKRTPLSVYRSQRRGGKGRTGMSTREEDLVTSLFTASTHDYLLVFTNRGQVYWLKVYEIPEVGPSALGKAIVNLLPVQKDERIQTVLPVKEFKEGFFAVMATRNGVIKKTDLSAYSNPRSTGIRAIVLDDDDELISVCVTDGSHDLFLMSRAGKSIRVNEREFRPLGRVSRGVRGMKLDGSRMVGMDVIEEGKAILVITEKGFGKRTNAEEYRCQSRGGKGVLNIRVTERNGSVVGFRQVGEDEQILMITDHGRLIRMPVAQISRIGRVTQGVKLMNLNEGEKVVDVAVLPESESESEESRENEES
ncbi:DNA gyrase subunit A [Syntrophobacter fumaroxidans]|uniref:DNA gyrase subunit A n=1 Tax=Syntrophobacter fumaroxidans (strain DSM 10017 / MPOB) TaxID=335543 RepID=A0LLR6_SYNFM|nr:DNA gyrase subunit A [Syntrophobacter fumaroxidans]ABK18368.1 DNA gyrase subunit A [Syntrophobacter fumaroxidans MPOB]